MALIRNPIVSRKWSQQIFCRDEAHWAKMIIFSGIFFFQSSYWSDLIWKIWKFYILKGFHEFFEENKIPVFYLAFLTNLWNGFSSMFKHQSQCVGIGFKLNWKTFRRIWVRIWKLQAVQISQNMWFYPHILLLCIYSS